MEIKNYPSLIHSTRISTPHSISGLSIAQSVGRKWSELWVEGTGRSPFSIFSSVIGSWVPGSTVFGLSRIIRMNYFKLGRYTPADVTSSHFANSHVLRISKRVMLVYNLNYISLILKFECLIFSKKWVEICFFKKRIY